MSDEILSHILDSGFLRQLGPGTVLPSFMLNRSTIFEELTPNEDRLIQTCVFSVLSIGSTEYGVSNFSIIEIEKILKKALKRIDRFKHLPDLIEAEKLKSLINEVSNKLNKRTDLEIKVTTKNDTVTLQECLYFNPCQEKIPDKDFCQLYEKVHREIESMWEKPVFLHEKIINLISREHALEKELDKPRLTFLMSSKFLRKNAILQKILEMLRNARKTIMFMISFYDPRLTIFPQVFKEQLRKNPSLEIKLLLRDEKGNKKLVLNIRKRLDEELKIRFSYAFFDIKKERGRMHAKTLIVDNREVLVGSANLTITSLKQNVETAIFTSEPGAVLKASDFFDQLWGSVEKNPNL